MEILLLSTSNRVICNKLEKAAELISLLYRKDLITDAYILGSVIRETKEDNFDIDIFVINPEFEETNTQLFPDVKHFNIKKVADYLKFVGVKFERLDIPTKDIFGFYFQIYKDEIFHIMYSDKFGSIESNEYLKITKTYCNGNIHH